MDILETLALVFTDQLVASLVFPINQPYVFSSIVLLQQEIVFLSTICAILGSFIGSMLNYGFGRLMARSFINVKTGKISDPKYRRFYYFFIFAPLAIFGTLITFLAGFGHMRLKVFILLTFVSHSIFIIGKALGFF